jgi:hypothetical protein
MKIKPILFSTAMVEAILKGRKTQTRRVIKSRHESGMFQVSKTLDGIVTGITSLDWDERPKNDNCNDIKPIANVGDILWVRETWQDLQCFDYNMKGFAYKADEHSSKHAKEYKIRWKPSIFMPKEAARIFLKITNVRVERLQDISIEDVCSEGLSSNLMEHDACCELSDKWESLWCKINGADSWESNPWVWAYDFEKVERPANFLRESEAVNA